MGFKRKSASPSIHDQNLIGGYYISQCNIIIIYNRYCWCSKRVFILFMAYISHIKKEPQFFASSSFLWVESIVIFSENIDRYKFFKLLSVSLLLLSCNWLTLSVICYASFKKLFEVIKKHKIIWRFQENHTFCVKNIYM